MPEGTHSGRHRRICVIPGDGIGPEVVDAAVEVLRALADRTATFDLEVEVHRAGFEYWQQSGQALSAATVESAKAADGVLVGAIDAARFPAGVAQPILILRQQLGIWGSLRPSKNFAGVAARSGGVDLLVVREAREGLYAGLETWHGNDECHAHRVVTRAASTKVAELAFASARQRRGKVTAIHKISALPASDGLFLDVVRRVAGDFDDVELEFRNVDACAMELVLRPEEFDVILATNCFGDILSDVAAGVVGGLGLAASACIGGGASYFEPVHGSAPDIAGQGIANPLAAILSAAMMLRHMGEVALCESVERAVRTVLSDPDLPKTRDLGGSATTEDVTRAVIGSLT
ncbi:isocitrate/isopropylmalate family dehydrogenase [Nocardia sp. R6R-6]|uniref:isocitrate/isopropylmalate family dehydrogenase n=1 Tax=Nocardia sp. R6R-6 TaxID=3459303 RepID=UPI00403DAE21